MIKKVLTIIVISLFSLPLGYANAEEQLIDEIVAFVADRAITRNELAKEIESYVSNLKQRNIDVPNKSALVGEVLQNLIVKNLQLHEAERNGVVANVQDINQMIAQIAQNNKLAVPQLRAKIEEQGANYDDFRKKIQEDVLIREVQRRRVVDKIEVSDEEIRSLLNVDIENTKFSYSIWQVGFDAKNQESYDNAYQQIKKIKESLVSGESYNTLQKENSKQKGVMSYQIVKRKYDDIPKRVRSKLIDMSIGQTSGLIKTPSKLYVFKLDGRYRQGETKMMQKQYRVRHIIITSTVIDTDEIVKKRLRILKRQIIKKDNFASVAERYSQDPGSNFKGGDLGWIAAETMVPEFAKRVKTSKMNQIVGPFRSQFGWHLLEILDSREQDISEDMRRSQAIAQIRQQRAEQEVKSWILRLREKYYIDVKI